MRKKKTTYTEAVFEVCHESTGKQTASILRIAQDYDDTKKMLIEDAQDLAGRFAAYAERVHNGYSDCTPPSRCSLVDNMTINAVRLNVLCGCFWTLAHTILSETQINQMETLLK